MNTIRERHKFRLNWPPQEEVSLADTLAAGDPEDDIGTLLELADEMVYELNKIQDTLNILHAHHNLPKVDLDILKKVKDVVG